MKKITFFIALLTISLGFSQNLLTNGDFENGSSPWTGNNDSNGTGYSNTVVDDGTGNFVNSALVDTAPNSWQVNLAQVLTLNQGQTYELSYDAYVDSGSATILTGVAENFGGFAGGDTASPTFTETSQNFTHTLTFNNATTTNGRVFFDLGGTANQGTIIFIDNVSLTEAASDPCANGMQDSGEEGVDCGGTCPDACPVPPATAAPDPPARDAGDVLSIFSGGIYSDVSVSGVNVFAGASLDNFTIDVADDTRRLTATNPGGGAQYEFFNASPALDLTDFTHLHIDFYVEGDVAPGQQFQVFLLDFPNYPDGVGSQNINTSFDVNATGSGAWISGDVALDDFNNGMADRNQVALVQVVAAGAPAFGPIYFDNLYFYKLNDDCDNAEVIDSADFGTTISGTNVGATDSGLSDGCVTGNDVWYSFTAVQDGEVNVTLDSGFQYAFYSDCMGTLIGSCNISLTTATTGATYYLRIGDDGTTTRRTPGGFNLSISGSALSTDNFDLLSSLKIYPNPTNNSWSIEGANVTIDTIEVYDILGKRVTTISPNASQATIDASNLRTGLYLAKLYSGDAVTTIKLVKN